MDGWGGKNRPIPSSRMLRPPAGALRAWVAAPFLSTFRPLLCLSVSPPPQPPRRRRRVRASSASLSRVAPPSRGPSPLPLRLQCDWPSRLPLRNAHCPPQPPPTLPHYTASPPVPVPSPRMVGSHTPPFAWLTPAPCLSIFPVPRPSHSHSRRSSLTRTLVAGRMPAKPLPYPPPPSSLPPSPGRRRLRADRGADPARIGEDRAGEAAAAAPLGAWQAGPRPRLLRHGVTLTRARKFRRAILSLWPAGPGPQA